MRFWIRRVAEGVVPEAREKSCAVCPVVDEVWNLTGLARKRKRNIYYLLIYIIPKNIYLETKISISECLRFGPTGNMDPDNAGPNIQMEPIIALQWAHFILSVEITRFSHGNPTVQRAHVNRSPTTLRSSIFFFKGQIQRCRRHLSMRSSLRM